MRSDQVLTCADCSLVATADGKLRAAGFMPANEHGCTDAPIVGLDPEMCIVAGHTDPKGAVALLMTAVQASDKAESIETKRERKAMEKRWIQVRSEI